MTQAASRTGTPPVQYESQGGSESQQDTSAAARQGQVGMGGLGGSLLGPGRTHGGGPVGQQGSCQEGLMGALGSGEPELAAAGVRLLMATLQHQHLDSDLLAAAGETVSGLSQAAAYLLSCQRHVYLHAC